MVGETALRRVQLKAGYAQIKQHAVQRRHGVFFRQAFHVVEVSANGVKRGIFAQPLRRRGQRVGVSVHAVNGRAASEQFARMASAAQRTVQIRFALRRFQRVQHFLKHHRNVVKFDHFRSISSLCNVFHL